MKGEGGTDARSRVDHRLIWATTGVPPSGAQLVGGGVHVEQVDVVVGVQVGIEVGADGLPGEQLRVLPVCGGEVGHVQRVRGRIAVEDDLRAVQWTWFGAQQQLDGVRHGDAVLDGAHVPLVVVGLTSDAEMLVLVDVGDVHRFTFVDGDRACSP